MRVMDIFVWFLIACAALTALCLLAAAVLLPLALLLNGFAGVGKAIAEFRAELRS